MKTIPHTKKMILWVAMLAVIFGSLFNTQAQGIVTPVTFDGPPSFLSGDVVRQYYESGVSLIATTNGDGYSGFSRRLSGASLNYPYNGTAYIQGSSFAPVVIALADGGLFGLFSVDLAERSIDWPYPATVTFVGYMPDGTTVVSTFTTDGIIGVPGTPDFQTFYFGSEFNLGLARVEIPVGSPSGFALDNLVLGVPEPTAGTLGLLGGGLLLWWQQWRRSRP